ncbi:MAG: hypothetical protein R2716_06350 [Microthrixaceae bacterium]
MTTYFCDRPRSEEADVFLKSLQIKGFKSFADPAQLGWAGVTVVVRPNGSGKSNVVGRHRLGAQACRPPRRCGAKKMDDVIFAGTESRLPSGGASPHDRQLRGDPAHRVHRGDDKQAPVRNRRQRVLLINGTPARLLDIQRLLSDSGVGRQQHVIVSQGERRRGPQRGPRSGACANRGSRRGAGSTAGARSAPSAASPPPRPAPHPDHRPAAGGPTPS